MWTYIIYFVAFAIFIPLVCKAESEIGFLEFDNPRVQSLARALFVIIIISTIQIPYPVLSNASFKALNTSMQIFTYAGLSLLFAIAGIIVGFITLGIINVIIWIFK